MLHSPLSMHAHGSCEADALGRGRSHTFPDPQGGLTAGLHYSIFTMQNQPVGPQIRRVAQPRVSTGPSPEQALTRSRKGRR